MPKEIIRGLEVPLSFNPNNLEDHLRIKIDFIIPELTIKEKYNDWGLALLETKTWTDGRKVAGLELVDKKHQLFIQSFVHTSRLLCELGRLPIFDPPRIVSFSGDQQNPNKYLLEIELFLVEFLPQAAYQFPIRTALELCLWMIKNSPTSENKSKIFNAITAQVIKPLRNFVPAGKSVVPLLRVAHSLDIPFMHLGLGVYQVGWGSKARRLDRSACDKDSAIGSKLVQYKVSAANILRAAGLPSPLHGVATTENDALAMAGKIGFPIVLKPTDQDRGEGVTVDISCETELKAAFAHAQKLSNHKAVIVERQVLGVCHRLFVSNKKLLYAVKRHPMSVIGDGNKTIKQLVDDELSEQSSKAPWSRSEIKPIDELTLKTLERHGLTSDSVPISGAIIPLRKIESTEWGGIDEEVTAVVHPENVAIALQAAQLFNLHIAGIDIITQDITEPWYVNGAIINEVNFAPLFGGAEISRSHIPQFFAEFIDRDGRIPIEVFETEKAALKFQSQQRRQGKSCYFTSAEKTLDDSGKRLIMPFKNLKQRVRALIMRSEVDVIAVMKS